MLASRNAMVDVGEAPPAPVAANDLEDEDPDAIKLEELMEDLSINDGASVAGDEDDEAFVDPDEL